MPPSPGPAGVRRWTLATPTGPLDVEVAAPEEATLGDVRAALRGDGYEQDIWVGSDRLPADVPLSDPRLRHGARLGLGRSGPRSVEGGGALELHVSGGPDAGRTLALAQGVLVVGRGRGGVGEDPQPGPRVSVADPDVSRRHLEVAVTGSGVTVRDLGSSNGSSLEGTAGAGGGARGVGADPVPWPLGAVLRAGSSSLRLTAPSGPPVAVTAGSCGRVLVRSVGRPAPPALPEVVVPVPEDPGEPPRRALAWVAIALPAVAGGLMAWFLAAPQFLFFAVLSPVVALGGWVSDRWSGRRGHRRRTVEHAAALARVEAEVAAALAREVAVREEVAPDPATVAAAVRRRAGPLWGRGTGDPDLLVLRLGVGPGTTGVLRRAVAGPGIPEPAAWLPVTADLRAGGLGVRGPRATVLGLVRSLVCQAAGLHPPDAVRITLVASTATLDDWRWARWLPHLTPPGTPVAPGTAHLVVVDGPLDDPTLEAVHAARQAGAAVLVVSAGGTTLDGQGLPVLEVLGETGSRARLRRPGRPDQAVVLDLVGPEVAAQLAEGLAPLDVPAGSGGIPDSVRWSDVVADRPPRWSRSRSGLTAVLGVGAAGVVELDLCAAGPHALVAGTTGAGKSELLRTLVLGLAAAHPPDLCSFLLVDYKGGAAFAEAADLPHTVGVLTDLDGASTARALRSLGAELTRRERVLAEHGVRDLSALPDGVLLPRLVIVVDEFATLGDELPGFVPGLIGIAQRGRSLGVHLVLATQRPSGTVSPEIRANCTVRLCLRTTDEAGSRDVLGLPDAAWLPVDRPGRALLRIGAAPPVTIQVARVGAPGASARRTVRVRPWRWPQPPTATAGRDDGPTDLAQEVAELAARASAAGLPAPPRPWLPVLPDRVEPQAFGSHPPDILAWGLLDRPERQEQVPLLLDLAAGGGWLVVGGPRSGRTTALRTLLAGAVGQLAPDELHVHVVDHAGGTLAGAAHDLPHTGTTVGRDDVHRLQRLVARLQLEVDARRGAGSPVPRLLLLVDGVDGVSAALEELEPGTGGATLLRLVREGAAVGLTCVLSADRVLPGSRLAAAAAHRLVLPFADRADYAVAGVPARSVPGHRPPGRALLDEDALEVQLALPRRLPTTTGRAAVAGRIEVVELPADPGSAASPVPRPGTVVVGPGGDDGRPVVVDLVRSGGLLVAGPAGSGRSTTLLALATRLAAAGTPVLHTGIRPLGRCVPGVATAGPGDVVALRAWGGALHGRPGVVLADDLGALPDPLTDAIGELTAPGGVAVLVGAASPADVAGAYRGPALALRRNRAALLLQPARGDAELLSVRLPRAPLPARPGSGWLVLAGTVTRLQVARR